MPSLVRTLSTAAVSVAMIAVPTGSIAAGPVSQPSVQQARAAASTNPWLALSAMTGSSSSASAAATAAQGVGHSDLPPVAPLAVILGTIALGVWILLHDGQEGRNGGDGNEGNGNSVDDWINILVPTPQIPVSPA